MKQLLEWLALSHFSDKHSYLPVMSVHLIFIKQRNRWMHKQITHTRYTHTDKNTHYSSCNYILLCDLNFQTKIINRVNRKKDRKESNTGKNRTSLAEVITFVIPISATKIHKKKKPRSYKRTESHANSFRSLQLILLAT